MPSLQESLFSFPSAEQVPILALSGGGGKTTALFGLADELSARGARGLVTTTTRIRDPRAEGRGFDRFLEIPGAYATSEATAAVPLAAGLAADPAAAAPPGRGPVTVLCAGVEGGKLVGLDPGIFPALAASGRWDAILVEADGARMRPVKAPAPYEPVWPAGTTSALGVVGLDCLGRPLDDRVAHRPELLGALVGLEPGGTIELGHLLRLARHPEGLFRGVPGGARRILVLNKADLRPDLDPGALADRTAAGLAEPGPAAPTGSALRPGPGTPGIDLVLVCSLGDPDPRRRVRAAHKVAGVFKRREP
ncbi:MAG TPA: selenium cofactor biosynthesis protein YqeC [Spirochaetales bacterium]|nr:selenium cofactor biosynthesis protein YqeC [Spirochaetales bacterium]